MPRIVATELSGSLNLALPLNLGYDLGQGVYSIFSISEHWSTWQTGRWQGHG